ncbi:MoxR family ATPase [Vulcanisaeta distributa]|uniref:AAA family ATPase n=1 Tax=Vulcanisaeta distributa TaxID=164451 RepID=UPI0006D1E0DD|nr:MoxR family ATPase [Vulcanisaeta distributa]
MDEERKLREESGIKGDCDLLRGIYGESIIDYAFKLLSEYHALLILGPPGTGKTTLARCLARKLGADLIEATVHGWFSRMDLIGGYVLQSGDTVWRDGILLRAVKSGRKTLILLDEINRGGEPEKFLAELFTALSRPDKKLSIPGTGTALGSNDVMMEFSGNPFSIINSFRRWKKEGGEYVWGLESDGINKYILNKLNEYMTNGKRVFAGIFFYGRTYLNKEKDKVIRLLALFGEISSLKLEEDEKTAGEYMLNERFNLILGIKPLAYLKVLDNEERIFIINIRDTNEERRLNEIRDLGIFVNDRNYVISPNIEDENIVNKVSMPISLSDHPPLPLSYALGRWNETLTVGGFLRELESTGLYEFTEDGKRYLNSSDDGSAEFSLGNIYIVATANTADIGVLGGLGFALQRRFKVVRVDASKGALHKALDAFNVKRDEYLKEVDGIWDALERCLSDRLGRGGYRDYMPGWSYFIDYVKLRDAGFSSDEAFKSVFNIYVERLECTRSGESLK